MVTCTLKVRSRAAAQHGNLFRGCMGRARLAAGLEDSAHLRQEFRQACGRLRPWLGSPSMPSADRLRMAIMFFFLPRASTWADDAGRDVPSSTAFGEAPPSRTMTVLLP